MLRLAIICFLISMIESQDCYLDITRLNELKQNYIDSERHMEEATRDQKENAIIVLGNARSGKSTLINYLMKNELEAYSISKFEPNLKIRLTNKNTKGPEIGEGPVSKTSTPIRWRSIRPEFQNVDIWDTAGFVDNRGVMQDLKNSFSLYHLTKKVKNLKFILVLNFLDIENDNNYQIRTTLETLQRYFNNPLSDIFSSTSVIISKVPFQNDHNVPVNYGNINNDLQKHILSNSEMAISEAVKDFVRYIIKNNQHLAFFRIAQNRGKITSDIDENIISAIVNCDSIPQENHQNINFTISYNSRKCLLWNNNILLDMNNVEELTAIEDKFYKDNMHYLDNTFNKTLLFNKKQSFHTIYDCINDDHSFHNSNAEFKIKLLEKCHNTFGNFITKENLVNKTSLTEFIDSIIMSKKTETVNSLLKAALKTMSDRVSILISKCDHSLKSIDTASYNNKILKLKISQENTIKELKEDVKERPKEKESWWERALKNIGPVSPFIGAVPH